MTLDNIKDGQATFDEWWSSSPLLTGGLFFLSYAAVTALSLPGAAIMTLLAGALFGLMWGTVIVSFASSVGATLAFVASRYLFRDIVRNRFGNRLRVIDEGVKRDGSFYLFTLRLVPIFPFFLINILMGLTSIKTITFYWVSQIGMLAGDAARPDRKHERHSFHTASFILRAVGHLSVAGPEDTAIHP